MKPLHVAFLWHMHQPYYKDNLKNRFLMPWVRLHAIKGYFDMIDLLEDFPEMKATFNLVPSLIVQLQDYCKKETIDSFLELSLTPAADLTPEQEQSILFNFFMANWDNMIKPYPRYWELLVKRGFKIQSKNLLEASKSFTKQDFRDLQAWANLAWFGYRAKKKYPDILSFIKKERDFTDNDIHDIIDLQKKIILNTIPAYKKALKENRIELTTSAFYHPILPLIYDTNIASRCLKNSPLPKRFTHPEDAENQIHKSLDYFKKIFDYRPKGFWPSEGSVCPELIPIFEQQGIEWIATDEEILFHSKSHLDRAEALFKTYQAFYKDSSINIFFRDRGLSDLIGFTYSRNPGKKSAQDFIQHLKNIQRHQDKDNKEPAIVPIILDGENAWEYYSDGGEVFLSEIYNHLSKDDLLLPVTFSKHLKNTSKRESIENLYSGSWINHDFDIWIGSEEENTAWEYLEKTREFVSENKNAPPDKVKEAMEHIYIAEGSDWFWWYGDDFSTDNDEEFDRLFRLHLQACYQILNKEIPDYLHTPIIDIKKLASFSEPIGFIEPVIDGNNTYFYEWHEAGLFLPPADSSMHRAEKYIKSLFFGFSLDCFFLRIDPYKLSHIRELNDIQLVIYLTKTSSYKIVIPSVFKKELPKKYFIYKKKEAKEYQKENEFSTAAFENILELSIFFKNLDLNVGDKIKFNVVISKNDMILETHPKYGCLTFTVPTKEFETEMWSV